MTEDELWRRYNNINDAENASASAENTSASAENTSASAENTSASAENTSASAENTSASAENTSASAENTSANAENASASAENTSANLQDGNEGSALEDIPSDMGIDAIYSAETQAENSKSAFINAEAQEIRPPNSELFAPECFYTAEDESATVAKKTLSAKGLVIALVLLVFIVGVFCTVLLFVGAKYGDSAQRPTGVNIQFQIASKPEGSTIYIDENGKYTTEGIAEYVRPSVVEIYAYSSGGILSDTSYGSGIILTDDGYIATNTHIIDDAARIEVVLFDDDDERTYDATIIGKDKKTDIAVIKIYASNLPNAVLGNSDEVVSGEQVCAVGNPGGLNASITSGLVSAVNREIRSDIGGYKMDSIQTDAAISPGNSGGALVNMYGQVIGITSSKYADVNYEGLGFAITINQALPIIEDIIKNGFVSGRVRIGISFVSVSEEEAKDNGTLAGLIVSEIAEDCDIANTKLQSGDIIVKMNGVSVTNYDEVLEAIDGLVGGDTVNADIVRINDDSTQERFEISFKLMDDKSGDY